MAELIFDEAFLKKMEREINKVHSKLTNEDIQKIESLHNKAKELTKRTQALFNFTRTMKFLKD